MRGIGTLLLIAVGAGQLNAQGPAGPVACKIEKVAIKLPVAMRETSGLAAGSNGLLWTHNDGNSPVLYAIDTNGALRAQIQINHAKLTDWEDFESGACDGGLCLYVADIGDNDAARADVAIHEILEPLATAKDVSVRRTLRAKYEDGPRDAEALFRTPTGEFFVVTKGRHGPVTLYRWHQPASGDMATLRPVRQLAPHPTDERDRVTAATMSSNGEWVAIRTYRNLDLYRTNDLLANGAPVLSYPLAGLEQKQGESLTLTNNGTIWTTSEAEKSKDVPSLAQLRCALPQ